MLFYSEEKKQKMKKELVNLLRKEKRKKGENAPIVFLCIGSDRSTSDSLGPFIGSFLKKNGIQNVHGSIESPVHARNLEEEIQRIHCKYPAYILIAIDVAKGSKENYGKISMFQGSLQPGAASQRGLPFVGDISIIGILRMENERLFHTVTMANAIGEVIEMLLLEKIDTRNILERYLIKK